MNIKETLSLANKTIWSFSRRESLICLFLILTIFFSTVSLIFTYNKNFPKTNNNNIFIEGVVGKVKVLNPLFVEFNNTDRDICSLIFSGLSKYDPIQKQVVDDLATHTLNFDQKVYSFKIKDNVFWHDGQPVTADDVYFTYHDLIQNPDFKNPILKSNLEGVTIKKINEKTVEFHLKEINSFFFTNTTIGLLSKHLWQNVPVSDLEKSDLNLQPIGTGLYKVKEPLKSTNGKEEISLTKFDNYYGLKSQINNLILYIFPTMEELIENRNIVHGIFKIVTQKDKEKIGKENYFNIYDFYLPQYTAVFLNTDAPLIKEKNIRLALLKAINQEELALMLDKKDIDTPFLETDQNNWINKFSLQQANGALYDLNWRFDEQNKENKQQIRKNKKGELLELNLIALKPKDKNGEEEINKLLNYLRDSWLKIGCNVKIELVEDNKVFQDKIRLRQYDLLLYGQHLGYNFDTYAYWHSSQAGNKGLNLSNYRNLKADALIENIRTTFQTEEKQKKLNQLGLIINNDIPAIFLFTPVYHYGISKRVKNIHIGFPTFPSDRLTNIFQWEFTN